MTTDYQKFHKQLQRIIQSEINVAYPIIGVIVEVSSNREYCSIQTDEGIISNIPAHGIPVIGDSAIIHFINGNYEQPVADCARRMEVPETELKEMYASQCFNYHRNGDFQNDDEGYSGTFTVVNEPDDVTEIEKACQLELGEYISFTCDISECTSDFFKFQCAYRGNGYLKIECHDAETGEIIQTLPVNIAQNYKIWNSEYGRFRWAYNKEAYIRNNTKKVKFTITNVNEDTPPQMLLNGEKVDAPNAMQIDAILIYDENADINYYPHVDDLL